MEFTAENPPTVGELANLGNAAAAARTELGKARAAKAASDTVDRQIDEATARQVETMLKSMRQELGF